MTTANDPEMVAELDRLNAAVADAPAGDTSAQIALWQQVARLGTWFFIARGEPDQPRPYGVASAHGAMICLYSSPERAQEAAREQGVADPDGGIRLMGVPMPAALDYLASFAAAGVYGVTLDHPRIGHYIPLQNLQMLKSWLEPDAR